MLHGTGKYGMISSTLRCLVQAKQVGTTPVLDITQGTTPRTCEREHMPWVILTIAGIFEIGWAIGLKYTEGFTKLWPTVGTVLSMVISLGLLGMAMKSLPVGTAYAVWVGVGAVGTVILGIVLFGEPANTARIVSVALIVAGIIGLKLATPV